jgi:sugar phosphate permease
VFFISYAIFQVPSNLVLARVGAHIWLSAMTVAWGAVAASFAGTNSAATFLALRFALGLTECGVFPGIWHHLQLFYTQAELGPAYAAAATSTALAQVLGAPMAAALLSLDGLWGLRGWQWLFLVEGESSGLWSTLHLQSACCACRVPAAASPAGSPQGSRAGRLSPRPSLLQAPCPTDLPAPVPLQAC